MTETFPNLETLGLLAKQRRESEGISQKALADLAECSHVSIIALEKGAGRLRLGTAWKILDALGLLHGRSCQSQFP